MTAAVCFVSYLYLSICLFIYLFYLFIFLRAKALNLFMLNFETLTALGQQKNDPVLKSSQRKCIRTIFQKLLLFKSVFRDTQSLH